MNYLAHAFLSGSDKEILIGNFIADAVRGKQILAYSEGVQKGIMLHREIDAFTDTHEIVALTKDRLRPKYGKYAPVIADMFYDHFLAAGFTKYSDVPLPDFSEFVYNIMLDEFTMLPERVKYFLPYMIEHNWLKSYAEIKGINQALKGLSRRTAFVSGMETASVELEENYEAYQKDFDRFFPELMTFTGTIKLIP